MTDSSGVSPGIIDLEAFKVAVMAWLNSRAMQVMGVEPSEDFVPVVELSISNEVITGYITGVQEADNPAMYDFMVHVYDTSDPGDDDKPVTHHVQL